jgi:hypothetical protein
MNSYPCPAWLKCRGITDSEYARWLEKQTKGVWTRELSRDVKAHSNRADLKQALHRAAHESDGHDPYSGVRFDVKHFRAGWTDGQAHLRGNRHHRTLRRNMPSFDHVKGLARPIYQLCTRETNSAKSYMSPKQFVDLCRRVARHRGPGLQAMAGASDRDS